MKKEYRICSKKADLHIHTTASDGILEPNEVVRLAKKSEFTIIAITDHDTIGGLDVAINSGKELGIEIIPGIELSTLDSNKEIHILGYFINQQCNVLIETLSKIIYTRRNRAIQMVKNLNLLGVDISLNRVQEFAKGKFIGRPHIAMAMMEKGYIQNIKEAFTPEFIGRGGKAYIERFEITPRQAIELINEANGISVLAHPGFLSDGTALSEEEIFKYSAMGLHGLEAYYAKHTPEQIEFYRNIALNYDLLITGGSDWHGHENDIIFNLPFEYVDALKKFRNSQIN